jgi:hypothetical protein
MIDGVYEIAPDGAALFQTVPAPTDETSRRWPNRSIEGSRMLEREATTTAPGLPAPSPRSCAVNRATAVSVGLMSACYR